VEVKLQGCEVKMASSEEAQTNLGALLLPRISRTTEYVLSVPFLGLEHFCKCKGEVQSPSEVKN
jgi:hypothetical protein